MTRPTLRRPVAAVVEAGQFEHPHQMRQHRWRQRVAVSNVRQYGDEVARRSRSDEVMCFHRPLPADDLAAREFFAAALCNRGNDELTKGWTRHRKANESMGERMLYWCSFNRTTISLIVTGLGESLYLVWYEKMSRNL